MRLAVVVQRYGDGVAGGAELHARYVAELLAGAHQVTVLTTTARDYLTWQPEFPSGATQVSGVDVIRFDVDRCRDLKRFADAAARAYGADRTEADERRYLDEQGPYASGLWRHLRAEPDRYDAVIAFSYRYVTTWEAAMAVPERTILVPTAERDPAVELEHAKRLFRAVAAIAYNSHEERAMIQAAAGNEQVPGEVVGVFSRIPAKPDPARFRERYGLDRPYLLYVGRIDGNKGCDQMFADFAVWLIETGAPHELLLIGKPVLELPDHPRIRHLGFLSDEDKFDALAGAEVLWMPSPYESLSMVTLEAMASAVPPLVNGDCDVLRGQVRRSNAGLYYQGYDELFEALSLLVATPRLRRLLGHNGVRFYRENYDEAVVAKKYARLLDEVSGCS